MDQKLAYLLVVPANFSARDPENIRALMEQHEYDEHWTKDLAQSLLISGSYAQNDTRLWSAFEFACGSNIEVMKDLLSNVFAKEEGRVAYLVPECRTFCEEHFPRVGL